MPQETSPNQSREAATPDIKRARENDGLFKIVLVSLSGLTLSLIMTAQGLGPTGVQLMMMQLRS
jgi:hypothetical protein